MSVRECFSEKVSSYGLRDVVTSAGGMVLLSLMVAGLFAAAESLIVARIATGSETTFTQCLLAPGNQVLWHRFLIFLLILGLGLFTTRTRHSRDRAERALVDCRESFRSELALSENQLRLAAEVFESSIEGIAVTDRAGTIQTVNPAFTEITGYSAEEAIGENPRMLKSDRHGPEFYKEMWQTLVTTGRWSGEIWNRHKSGRAFPEWLTISAVKNQTGEITNYVSVFHDMSDLKAREQAMHHLAHHDALTGLANRLLFDDHLNLALAQARRLGATVALIYADIDDFKAINDNYGHATGDRLLQDLADRLNACVREDDTVARLGGDEFVIILPGLENPSYAHRVMHSIQKGLASPFLLGDHEEVVNLSIGVAFFPTDGGDGDALLHQADLAMYQAKDRGKNGVNNYPSPG